MKSTKTLIAAFAVLSAAAFAAPAQAATAGANDFGKCVVAADRGAALGLLDRLSYDRLPAQVDAGSLRGAAKCGPAPAMSSMVLRGAIIEALYKKDFVEFGMQPKRAPGDFVQLNLPEGAADPSGKFMLAMCVARSSPVLTDKLFATPAGSDRERAVVDQIMPYFAACQTRFGGAGSRAALSLGEIRSVVAHGAYATSVRYWSGQMHAINAD